MSAALSQTKKTGFGLVRDKSGRPRIDDPATLHPGVASSMSVDERLDAGLWPGVIVRDAVGYKRAYFESFENGALTLTAVDEIKAAALVYYDGVEYRFGTRINAPVGETLVIDLK